MSFISYYEKIKKERYKQNAEICKDTAQLCLMGIEGKPQKYLVTKIKNAIDRGLVYWATTNEILQKLSAGERSYLAMFAIDPTRQTLSEESQLNYVVNQRKLKIFKSSEDWRLTNDGSMIVKGKQIGSKSKSFDYVVENYFGVGKVTFSKGGHQDNVEEEVRKYLNECVNYTRFHDDEKKFFFLLDGSLLK